MNLSRVSFGGGGGLSSKGHERRTSLTPVSPGRSRPRVSTSPATTFPLPLPPGLGCVLNWGSDPCCLAVWPTLSATLCLSQGYFIPTLSSQARLDIQGFLFRPVCLSLSLSLCLGLLLSLCVILKAPLVKSRVGQQREFIFQTRALFLSLWGDDPNDGLYESSGL